MALKERSTRIAQQYGTLLLEEDGLSSKGLEKKAALRSFVSKIMYLADELSDPEACAAAELDLAKIFGCQPRDLERIRIVSLQEVDLGKLDQMASEPDVDDEEVQEQQGKQQQQPPQQGQQQ